MARLGKKGELLFVLLLAIVLTIPWIGLRPFATRGEGREGIVVDSILRTGDWILPSGYGDNVPSKPPMTHWLAALASLPQGLVNEFTMRLPSALASVFLAGAFFIFLERRLDFQLSALTLVVLLTSLEWSRAALTSRVDMLLSASLFGALISLFSWEQRGLRGIPIVALICLSIATLAKGPVALALGLGIFGLYLFVRAHSFKTIFCKLPLLLLLAVVPPLLWYLAAYRSGGEKFLEMVWSENFARFAGSMEDPPHEHSAFYLLGTLALGFIPWSFFLVVPTITQIGRIKNFSRGHARPSVLLQRLRALDPLFSYALIVVISVFLFYCIPASKRSVYLLPLYPCSALFIAAALLKISQGYAKAGNRIVTLMAVLISTLLTGLLLVGFGLLPLSDLKTAKAQYWANLIKEYVTGLYLFEVALICAVLTLALVILVPRWRRAQNLCGYRGMAALQLGSLIFLNASILPHIATSLSPKDFAWRASTLIPAEARVLSFNDRLFDLDFYLPQKMYEARSCSELRAGDAVFIVSDQFSQLNSCLNAGLSAQLVTQSPHGIEKAGRIIDLYFLQRSAL